MPPKHSGPALALQRADAIDEIQPADDNDSDAGSRRLRGSACSDGGRARCQLTKRWLVLAIGTCQKAAAKSIDNR